MKTKNRLISFLLVIGVLLTLGSMSALATTYRSAGTGGNWNAMATWEYDNGGGTYIPADATHQYPSLGDVATITTGTTVTGNATVSLATLTVDANAVLNMNFATTVSGTLQVNGSGTMTTSAALTAATITNAGTMTVGGDVSVTTITVTGTIKPDGGLRTVTVAGSMTAGAASAVEFINTTGGTGRLSWTFTGTGLITNLAKSFTATNLKMYNLNVSATGSVTVDDSSAIYITGDLIVTNGSFNSSVKAGPTNTNTIIIFDNALTGASKSLTNTGGTLILRKMEVTTGSTVNSASYSGIEINGDLTIDASGTYNINYPQSVTLKATAYDQTITANGNLNLNGSGLTLAELWIDNNTSAKEVKLATSLPNINGSFYVKSSGATGGLNLQGYSISGTGNFTAQTGAYLKMNNNNGTYGGVVEAIKVTGNRVFDDAVNYTFLGGKTGFTGAKKSGSTVSNIVTVNDVAIGAATGTAVVTTSEIFTVAGNFVITAGGTNSFTATSDTITFSTGGRSINPNAKTCTFNNIAFTNAAGTITIADPITVTGSFLQSGAGTVTIGSGAADMVTFTGTGSLITTNATSIVGGFLASGFTVNNGSGTLTVGSNITLDANSKFTLTAGKVDMGTKTITSGAANGVTISAGTVVTANAAGFAGSFPNGTPSYVSVASGINLIYNGTNSQVSLGLVGGAAWAGTASNGANTFLDRIGSITLTGGSSTAASPAIADYGATYNNVLQVSGNFVATGYAVMTIPYHATNNRIQFVNSSINIASTSAVQFNGVDIGGTVTTSSNFSITGVLSQSAGTFVASSPSYITLMSGVAAIASPSTATGTTTFYNLKFADNGVATSFAPTGFFTVNGDILFAQTGAFTPTAAGTITLAGNEKHLYKANGAGAISFYGLTVSGTTVYAPAAGSITWNGATVTTALSNFTIIAAGTLTVSGTLTAGTGQTTTFDAAGTLNATGGTANLYNLVQTATGAVTSNGTINIANNWNVTAAGVGPIAWTHQSGTIRMTGAAGVITSIHSVTATPSIEFANGGTPVATLEIASGAVTTLTNNADANPILDVNGDAKVVVKNGGTMTLVSSQTLLDGLIGGSGTFSTEAGATIDFTATDAQGLGILLSTTTINLVSNTNYIINGTTANAGFDGSPSINNPGNITIKSSALVDFGGNVAMNGNLTVANGGSYIEGTATRVLTFNLNDTISVVGTGVLSLANITVAATGNLYTSSDFALTGTGNAINVTAGGSVYAADGVITQSGAGVAFVNAGAASKLVLNDLTIGAAVAKTMASASLTINGNLDIPTGASLTGSVAGTAVFAGASDTIKTAGTAALTLYNASITGNVLHNGATTITVAGKRFDVTGSFTQLATATTTFTGANDTIVNNGTLTFGNLTVNGGDLYSRSSFTIGGNLTMTAATDAFTDTTGTITLSGATKTITGAVANAITPATGGIAFHNLTVTGNYTIVGNNGFYVGGNIVVPGTLDLTSGATTTPITTIGGSSTKSINAAGGTLTFYDLTIEDKANNNVISATDFKIAGDITVGGPLGGTFVASAGTVDLNGTTTTQVITNGTSTAAGVTFFNLKHSGNQVVTMVTGTTKEIYVKGSLENSGAAKLDFLTNTTKVTLNGTTEQGITVTAGSLEFYDVDLSNASGAKLYGNIAASKLLVGGTLRMNNGDIDLNGNNILTIDGTATNSKLQETPGNTVKNSGAATSTGNVQITIAGASALQNVNVGGLGMQITTAVAPFGTTIKRFHIAQALGGSSSGYQTISRYYEVTTTTATGLNAQIIMKYDDTELNGNTKSALNLVTTATSPWLSTNNTWLSRAGVVSDANNNMLLITGLDNFLTTNKYWSAGYAPTLTITQLKKGLVGEGADSSVLTAGRTNQGVYGVKLTSTGTMEVSRLKFNFYGATAVARPMAVGNPEFLGFALVRSDDDVYSSDDQVILSNLDGVANTKMVPTVYGSFGNVSTIEFDLSAASDKQTITSDAAKYYFLVANVNTTSNITSALTPLRVYMTQADVTADGGLVTNASVTGTKYTFQPGLTFTWIPDGMATSPLTASSTNNGIMGFAVKGTNTATLGGFAIDFNSDPREKIESFKVYRSTDREFSPSTDAEVTNFVSWSSDHKTATITFGTEATPSPENVLTTDKYYFFSANTKAGVNGATEVLIPSFDNTKIVSTTAGYTPAQQVLTAPTYEFGILSANVTIANMTPAKNIGKGIVNQPVYAFAIEPATSSNVTFTGLTVNATFANNATNGNFTSYKLWYDDNGDGYPQSTESNWNGTYTGSSTEGTITFSGITAQTFSSARKYIITCNVLSTATTDGTMVLQLKNQNYVTLSSPAVVNNFAPLNGNTQTVKTPGTTATKIAIVGYSTHAVTTGGTVQITVQQQDANGTPVNASAVNTLTAGSASSCTLGGTLTANITVGSDVATFTSLTLANATGTTSATFQVSAVTGGTATTSNFKIYPAAPGTQATLTTTGLAARTVKSLSIDSWAAGTGAGRIFVVREGLPPVAPTDGIEYVGNTDISLCGNVGTGQTAPGSFVVYNELGAAANTAFTVTNLTAGKRYYIAVYEYAGSSSLTKYVQTMSSVTAPINVKYDTTLSGSTTDPYGTHNDWALAAFIATDCDVYGTIADTGIARVGSYYSFNVPSTSRNNLLIRLSDLPANYNITLYNGSRRFLREASNNSTTDEVIVINAANPGKYFLKVSGADSTQTSASRFKLRVSTSATEVMSPEE